MKNSIKQEIAAYLLGLIADLIITDDNQDEWHYYAFNEDYYIVGYADSYAWLTKHGLDAFEAIQVCRDYEVENFGQSIKPYDNAEVTANMLAYIYGEQFLNEADCNTVEELKEYCEEIYK
jgi:hypothetical protein